MERVFRFSLLRIVRLLAAKDPFRLPLEIDADCDLVGVAYGQGRFVAVGNTRSATGSPASAGGGLFSATGGLIAMAVAESGLWRALARYHLWGAILPTQEAVSSSVSRLRIGSEPFIRISVATTAEVLSA